MQDISRVTRPLRVAFIVDKFPNISETFILDEIVGLLRRGLEVHIYALRRGGAQDIHPVYLEFGLRDRTSYSIPAPRARIARLAATLGSTLAMARRNPWAVVVCAFARKRGIATRSFVSLARSFVNNGQQYDIVHAHFGPNGVRAEVLRRANVFHAPIVTTFHGYDVSSFVARNGLSAYADLARNGDRFIAVSKSIASEMEVIGLPAGRTELIPLGVQCRPPGEHRIAELKVPVRILSIGRFVEKKGFEIGIRAVALARARFSGLRYDIIGDGELRLVLESVVQQIGAASFVTFHGFKDQGQIGSLLAQADIMLVPSITAADGDREGLPVVVKEAMAYGIPVIASRHAGIPEIVVDGVTGKLAAEGDAVGLADHLVSLARDANERERLGAAAQRVIATTYDNERLIDDLVRLYAELSAGRAAHP